MSEKTEEQGIEVFGTKEVSVKEFMGGTDKSLMLLSNYELAKQNLDSLKEKHEARVNELVAIEKLSPAELKELNTIRGELREPRYLVQKIEKNNISVFETYKKTDKANLKALVDILKPTEDKADEKIKAEEDRKKNEKAEEARLEELRIKTIKDEIENFETSSYKIIQETKFTDIESSQEKLQALESAEFDYKEYDILFEQAKSRIENQWTSKVAGLREQEQQRLDNIRLEEEAKEQKRLSDLQAERLNEILPYVAFGEAVDLTKLSELGVDTYNKVLSSKKVLFEADSKKKQEEEEATAAKLKEENDAIFEVRKSRLLEIGFTYEEGVFTSVSYHANLSNVSVYNSSFMEFEGLITDAKEQKKEFEEAEEAKEKETESRVAKLLEVGLKHSDEHGTYFVASDSGWMVLIEDVADASPEEFEETLLEAKQAISDYQKSKEDAEALKKENKARIKKYAADKKVLGAFIESLDFHNPVPELENEDLQEALDGMLKVIKDMKSDLQEVLKNY